MKNILLVDDSGFSRNNLKRALGNSYKYSEANNGMTGLQLFVEENPDLVILDLTMPDMNGLEVLERIKQINPNAHVIINSADIQDFNKTKALEFGVDGFLNKPVESKVIQELVAKILSP